ncbi:uncharacterized protein LOC144639272 isoform X1 [Oculina patagonica]
MAHLIFSIMRFTVIVLHLAILAMGLSQAEDFICPDCLGWGDTQELAEQDCRNKLENTPCKKDQPQCVVHKDVGVMFHRLCLSGKDYPEELRQCNAKPGCQMGRCFTSGCSATLGEN